MSNACSITPIDVESPCRRQCKLDSRNICAGCFRSLSEIADWSTANPTERQKIIDRIWLRRQLQISPFEAQERTS